MRLIIVAAGRLKTGPERDMIDLYAARLKHAPASLGPLEEREIDDRKIRSQQEMEAAYLARLPPGARLIAWDERGKSVSSQGFSEVLASWRDEGVAETCFFIGPTDGLPEPLKSRADLVFSLGSLTWPHMVARMMVAEQLYRAASLLSGHPYHRD